MSRRYGRNQKRRHREEIARLEKAYELSSGLQKQNVEELQKVRSTMRQVFETIEAICPYSVALPPKEVRGNGRRDRLELAVYEPLNLSALSVSDVIENQSFNHINLYALEVFLKQNIEQFSTAVHLQYSGGGHSCYMLSESALRDTPRDVLLARVIPEIGRELIRHITAAVLLVPGYAMVHSA